MPRAVSSNKEVHHRCCVTYRLWQIGDGFPQLQLQYFNCNCKEHLDIQLIHLIRALKLQNNDTRSNHRFFSYSKDSDSFRNSNDEDKKYTTTNPSQSRALTSLLGHYKGNL